MVDLTPTKEMGLLLVRTVLGIGFVASSRRVYD